MGLDEVRTMRDVWARAEDAAWMTRDAYRDAANNACGLSRSDRADALIRSRDYKRRAVRVSMRLNSKVMR